MVGMVLLPSLIFSTNSMLLASSSMSILEYWMRCSPKNCLARLQSGHQVAPYTIMEDGFKL